MWAVKMSNGRGHVEWFETLSVRTQADSKADARHFTSKEDADARADFCMRHADSFSGAFLRRRQGQVHADGNGRACLTAGSTLAAGALVKKI